MTLIFARDKSLESLKEALEARRTLAYSFGTIAGDEQLLVDFFNASVTCEVLAADAKGNRTYEIRNSTSLPYTLNLGTDPLVLDSFSAVRKTVEGGQPLRIEVLNMWYGQEGHPIIEIK
jgi:hypothetical protein